MLKEKKNKTFFSLLYKNKILLFVLFLSFLAQIIISNKYSQDKIIADLNNKISELKQYCLVNKGIYKNLYTGIINDDEFELIRKEIIKNLDKKIKDCKLIFRASRDGFKAQDFHKKCDGRINTLSLVKTKLHIRIGGFTENSWDSNSGYKNEKKGFVFSLNNKKIFYNDNDKYNIFCDKDVGPSFIGGKYDFSLVDKCNI